MSSVSGITHAGSAVAQAQLQNKVGIAVLQKQQESAKQVGDAMVSLIKAAGDIGGQIDIKG